MKKLILSIVAIVCSAYTFAQCNQLVGRWQRTTSPAHNECLGMIIQYDGYEGKVVYAPKDCSFSIGEVKWKELDHIRCTLYDELMDYTSADHPQYMRSAVVTRYGGPDKMMINGVTYERLSDTTATPAAPAKK
jgi:hypothetical protein